MHKTKIITFIFMLAFSRHGIAQASLGSAHGFAKTLLFFLLSTVSVYSRSFTGTVSDASGKALRNVTVTLLNAGGRIMAYTVTAGDGGFCLKEAHGKAAAETIEFRCMGYATVSLPAERFREGQTVTMNEASVTLREVKVKAAKIRQDGDTLNYMVRNFMQGQDRSIADAIARMPGMEVSPDGTVRYQGRSINKFYIEGMDLMGAKYGTASNNIDARKVRKVQVIENHQPVRALKDVSFSDQAALNIVLEDSVRDIWQGDISLGSGSTLQDKAGVLYDNRVLAMLFSRGIQSLSMYKNNNTGKDISSEIGSIGIGEGRVPVENGVLSTVSAGGTGLEEKRSLFNDTHVTASNWLLKTRRGNDLRLQVTGLFDKSLHRQQTETFYTDIGSGAVMTEDFEAHTYRRELSGELMYKVNTDRLYLVNTVSGYADFNSSSGTAVVNGEAVHQSVRPRKRYVTDNFKMIKNLRNGRSFTLASAFSYTHLPGTLLLADSTGERLAVSSIYWDTKTNFRHKLAQLFVTYTAGLTFQRQEINVDNRINTEADAYHDYCAYLQPSLSFSRRRVELSLQVPLKWRLRSLGDNRKTVFTAEPGLFVSYEPTPRWNIYANYSYSWSPRDALSSTSLTIFTDYLSASAGNGRLDYTAAHYGGLRVNYKDALHSFFFTAGANYANSRHMPLYAGSLSGNVYFSTPTGEYTGSENLSLNARISKGFNWASLLLSLSANQSWYNYDLLIKDMLTPMRSSTTTANASVKVKPAAFLSFDLTSSFSHSVQTDRTTGNVVGDILNYFTHRLKTYVLPGNWIIGLTNELYHSNDKSVSTAFFSDLTVSYKTRAFEAGLDFNNIFGKQQFSRHYFTDRQRIYTTTQLRQREVVAKFRVGF